MLDVVREEFPEAAITVIVGGRECDKVCKKIGAMPGVDMKFDLTSEEIFSIMSRSDIAVTSAGQTLYELACMGVPAVAISVVENQELALRAFCRAGYLLDVPSWESADATRFLGQRLRLLKDSKMRERLSKAGQTQIDGKGAQRLVQILIEKVIL